MAGAIETIGSIVQTYGVKKGSDLIVALGIGMYEYGRYLGNKRSVAQRQAGVLANVTSNSASLSVVWGRARVGGDGAGDLP